MTDPIGRSTDDTTVALPSDDGVAGAAAAAAASRAPSLELAARDPRSKAGGPDQSLDGGDLLSDADVVLSRPSGRCPR